MIIVRQPFRVGESETVISESGSEPFATVFEDDGETGYFYAMDLRREERIVDAVHIYNVVSIDRQRVSEVEIVWSADGQKSILLINRYPHAAFNFSAKRGYCRTGFPRLPRSSDHWQNDMHDWDETIMDFFDLDLGD